MLFISSNCELNHNKIEYEYQKLISFEELENKTMNSKTVILIVYEELYQINMEIIKNANVIILDDTYNEENELKVYEKGFKIYLVNSELIEEKINFLLHSWKKNNSILKINKSLNEIRINGEVIKMSNKEIEVFLYLNERKGELCMRKDILTEVLNYHFSSDTRIVDVYIRYLRIKLKEEGLKIKTIRGKGYIYE